MGNTNKDENAAFLRDLAQNDYMIDTAYLPAGKHLLALAALLEAQIFVIERVIEAWESLAVKHSAIEPSIAMLRKAREAYLELYHA